MTMALLIGLLGAAVLAIEQKAVPQFKVLNPEGAAMTSRQLSTQSRWVLFYVTPRCRPCDSILRAMKDWDSPMLPARVVVIVRGPLADASAYVEARRPQQLSAMAWFADPTDDAWKALELKGTPVLIGVQDGVMKWAIAGVLNNPRMVESVVRTWVSQ